MIRLLVGRLKRLGRCESLVVVGCLSLIVLEELTSGTAYTVIMNSYSEEILIPITKARGVSRPSVGIVVVEADELRVEQYALARDTIRCYCRVHAYPLHEVRISDLQPELAERCPHKDFMFRRHCIVSHLLSSWSSEDWLLFLDADMAVINPNHLIEQFIPSDDNTHVVLYDRIFNHEVMAGSYLIRNNDYARKFLQFWADYEFKLPPPPSFHGTDNGAIHAAIIDYGVHASPELNKEMYVCRGHWNNSRFYDTLDIYEVCVRILLLQYPPVHIRILKKGFSWARDGWLTNSAWCDRDFFLHGWQERRLDAPPREFARWHSPFTRNQFDLDLCQDRSTAHLNWRYKDSFLQSNITIERTLYDRIRDVQKEFNRIGKLLASASTSL